MNASLVKFNGIYQQFIASQAPLQNIIPSFWQMVAEKQVCMQLMSFSWNYSVSQVGVIVMITKLVENNKKKADKYWPSSGSVKQYSGGVKVTTLYNWYIFNTGRTGWVQERILPWHLHPQKTPCFYPAAVSSCGRAAAVRQLAWHDSSRWYKGINNWYTGWSGHHVQILLDLVYKVQELNPDSRRPILVHCSAGVGRTGTFIALYKLVIDYQDPRRTNLSVFETVLHLRRFVSRLFIYVVSFFSFAVVAAWWSRKRSSITIFTNAWQTMCRRKSQSMSSMKVNFEK